MTSNPPIFRICLDVKKSKTLYNLHKPENLKKGRKKISKISGALPFSARTGQKVQKVKTNPGHCMESRVYKKLIDSQEMTEISHLL